MAEHYFAASRLNRRITIEQPVETPDGRGGFTRSWTALSEVFAEVNGLSGTERLEGAQLAARARYRIRIRALSGLTAAMRIEVESRKLAIRSITPMNDAPHIFELIAEEGMEA